jgi:hypothetical protein
MFDSFDEWLRYGYNKGWCGPDVCYTHDGLPSTIEEENDWESEPCIYIIRLYKDLNVKASVEKNHSPSVWRASNQGL